MDGACRTHGEMYTKCWSEKPKGRDHLGDPGVVERIILKWILEKQSVRVWNVLNRLNIGPSWRSPVNMVFQKSEESLGLLGNYQISTKILRRELGGCAGSLFSDAVVCRVRVRSWNLSIQVCH